MKRPLTLLSLAIILGSLLMALIPYPTVAADEVVVFPDPNLEAAIRRATAKPSGDIYQSDLSTVETILPGVGVIVDLTGLEYCTNLQALCLPRNAVGDLSPLSGLGSLAQLDLRWNQIHDISPLVNSPGLGPGDTLWLEGNPLSSTSRYTWIPILQARGVQVGWSMPAEHTAVWTPMVSGTTAALNSIWGNSPSDLFAVGDAGTIIHYDGSTWRPVNSGTAEVLNGVWGSSATDVFATGDNGTILHYDGITWTPMSSGTTSSMVAVWGSSHSNVFAVGGNAVLRYDGNSWSVMKDLADLGLIGVYDVWGWSTDDVVVIGREEMWTLVALHYDGITWSTSRYVPGFSMLFEAGVWGTSSQDLYAIFCGPPYAMLTTEENFVCHYDGTSWSLAVRRDRSPSWWNNDIWGSSASDVFAVGGMAEILHFDGKEWSSSHVGDTARTLNDVWGLSACDVFAVGRGGAIFHYSYPFVDSVSPPEATQGQSLAVTITGTKFDDVSEVGFDDGITVDSFVLDSVTTITANVSVANTAVPGPRDVRVIAGGGTTISFRAFSVNAAPPTLHSIRPTDGQHGQTLTVIITGDYLTGTETLGFGEGIAVDSFTVDSSTQVTCSITIAADAGLGARDVSVATPGGTCTLPGGFAVVETGSGTPKASPGTPAWVWICIGVAGGAVLIAASTLYFLARRRIVSK